VVVLFLRVRSGAALLADSIAAGQADDLANYMMSLKRS
jgi:hypothetical protein